jgi:DNA primase
MKKYSDEVIQQIVDKVDILEYIGKFVELEQHGKDYIGRCPFHNEDTPSFSVNPDKKIFFCFGCGVGNSIIDFVMMQKNIKFNQAVELLIGMVDGININQRTSKTIEFLKYVNRMNNKKCSSVEREIFSPSVMDKFTKSNIKEWIAEEISQDVMDRYDVRYDQRANRIVFPIYDIDGNIINVKGRTLYYNYKDLGLPKYIYYYPLHTLDFLYGFWQNKQSAIDKKEVIVFEGSKSVMKLESWGIKNVMSLETSRVNDSQINILLSLKCDIVFALDKGVALDKISKEVTKLKRFTKVYWIEDNHKILKHKDAPCDQGLFNFLQLYEERIRL